MHVSGEWVAARAKSDLGRAMSEGIGMHIISCMFQGSGSLRELRVTWDERCLKV